MSKSLDNHIRITDEPEEIFGKLMSLPDQLMASYAELLTDFSVEDFVKPKNPRDAKVRLATEIVAQFHSESAAKKAAAHFRKVFTDKQTPDEIVEVEASRNDVKTVSDAVALLFGVSKSEARRLMQQKGVRCNDHILNDANAPAAEGLYQKGSRHFKRLTFAG